MDHLPEPAIELWHKVVPLGMIFFCASFNLTILQVGSEGGTCGGLGQPDRGLRAVAAASPRAAASLAGAVGVVLLGQQSSGLCRRLRAGAACCRFP